MCLCHWLLGIGDRHLNNFLLDTTTGELVGIDFGHVFGTATTLLPVPELLPFRATPQLTGVFAPLGVDAAMRGPMVKALAAIRQSSAVLFCLMDVFVREPTLDWCKYAQKHPTRPGK
jgi:DNA-dependent protein kinase catalytic subunit